MNDRIRQKMDEAAAQALGTPDLWPALERRVARGSRRARWLPATRLGWAALTAIAVVLLGSVAYAAAPLVADIYRINPNWNPAARDESHLVHLTQTIDGCTVTLERVYVDSERILIGISAAAPGEMSLAPTRAVLRTEDGRALPFVDGAGHAEPGAGAYVLAFDATSLAERSGLLALDLSLSIHAVPVGEAPPPMAPPAEALAESAVAVALEPLDATLFGPYRFAVRVPTGSASQ